MQLCCWMQMSQYWGTSHTSSACRPTLPQCWTMARLSIGSCLPLHKFSNACITSSGSVAVSEAFLIAQAASGSSGPWRAAYWL